GPSAGNDVVLAIAIHVAGRDANAAGETPVISEEAGKQCAGAPAEGLDMGPAAGIRASDDVGEPVAVHIASRHEDAAVEIRGLGKEAATLAARGPTDVFAVWPPARPSAGHNVGHAVAIDIACRHANAAGKARIGENAERLGPSDRIKCSHV